MKDAIQIVNEIRQTPQYKKHILIMAKLTNFQMDMGYNFPEKKALHDLGMTSKKYEDILAGSRHISPDEYNKVLKYLDFQYKQAKSYKHNRRHNLMTALSIKR